MTGNIILDGTPDEAMRTLLRQLLEGGKVKAVLTLRRLEHGNGLSYSLIASPDAMDRAAPLTPVMPANGGQVLSHLTQEEPLDEMVAAVVRPCEVRAFNELVKRNKCFADNLVLISPECPGVYPVQRASEEGLDEALGPYWDAATKGETAPDLRPVCTGCERFEPVGVDMTVRLVGHKDLGKKLNVRLDSERAMTLVEGLKLTVGKDGTKDPAPLEAMRKHRAEGRVALLNGLEFKGDDMDDFIKQFGRCIGCHACSKVCPICYCQMCYFEARAADARPTWWRNDLSRKGAARVPPGTVLFHIGRILHMSISCVACGMCEDVCPVNIPIGQIFKRVGEATQGIFDYVPGNDPKEEIPIRTFEVDELHEVER